ncbi:nuclear transport factor 2 family protein [Reichenbachiella sp. MALMAid0571]|uniref:nuclear transport factor 2 family protein n=1 Tax=Reichenbachiella sp. MALMAid0571 TaxID=3143939 RepID=UPI0032DFA1A8
MKLNIKPDCGNAPKKELVKNLTIYFASYDIQKVMNYLENDIKWTLAGDEPIEGKERFGATLKEMSDNKVSKLTIHSIITHGKEAAINGEMLMEDGNTFAFSDFYEFSSAKGTKVKSIISYVVLNNKKPVASNA